MSRHCSALSCEWGGARTATPSEAGKLRLSKGTRLPKIAKHHNLWLDLTPARSQGGTVGIPQMHLGPTLPLIQRCFFRQQPHPCRKSSTLCRDSQPHLPLPPPCPHGDPPPTPLHSAHPTGKGPAGNYRKGCCTAGGAGLNLPSSPDSVGYQPAGSSPPLGKSLK